MLYRLYFTNFPYQALVCRAVSMQDAQRKARNYIRMSTTRLLNNRACMAYHA